MNNKYHINNIKTLGLSMLIICFMLLQITTFAQQNKVSQVKGLVSDNSGQALPGATVIIEGSTTGVTTDAEGKFTINANDGSYLVISFIGYKNERKKADLNETMYITLTEDLVTLGETVVVGIGYGTMRKSDLTGAIASVDAESMKKGVITSTEQLLQGKIAGLTVIQGSGDPASGASLRLRGGTSLSASNGPLIVVDGIPGVDINNIHPSEIVSIDILKDASSAAIYGSRGANGVIMVTTKHGNKGKDVISINSYWGTSQINTDLNLLTGKQWYDLNQNQSIYHDIFLPEYFSFEKMS